MEYHGTLPSRIETNEALNRSGGLSSNGKDKQPAEEKPTSSEAESLSAQEEEQLLRAAVRRLNGKILGLVIGLVGGLLLFVATLWLVIKGGETVGPHLVLLSQFLPGYRVTVGGGFLGLFYGGVVGFLFGWFIAWVYNWVVDLKHKQR